MTDKEKNWGKERGIHLYNTSSSGIRMAAERSILEKLDLKLDSLPLCSEEEAVLIEGFIPRAKEGFVLSLKADSVSPDELLDLLVETTPQTISGIWKQIRLNERHNTLPEYGHTMASLAILIKMRNVAYFDFSYPPDGLDFTMGTTETFWYLNRMSPGNIWEVMCDLEQKIRHALYNPNPRGQKDLLEVGHFFSAGKEAAKVFMDL